MEAEPILLLLNRTAGIEAGFDMSSQCQCLVKQIKEEEKEYPTHPPKGFPLADTFPRRVDPTIIKAVQEIGEKCST